VDVVAALNWLAVLDPAWFAVDQESTSGDGRGLPGGRASQRTFERRTFPLSSRRRGCGDATRLIAVGRRPSGEYDGDTRGSCHTLAHFFLISLTRAARARRRRTPIHSPNGGWVTSSDLGLAERRPRGASAARSSARRRDVLLVITRRSRDCRIDGIWGGGSPSGAAHTLDDHVRLRKALAPTGSRHARRGRAATGAGSPDLSA
jgi:hypothetical protein